MLRRELLATFFTMHTLRITTLLPAFPNHFEVPCFLTQHSLGLRGQACGELLVDSLRLDELGIFRFLVA